MEQEEEHMLRSVALQNARIILQARLSAEKALETRTEELARSHRTLEKTLSAFPSPVFILNEALDIELRNPSANRFDRALLREGHIQLPAGVQGLVQKALESGRDYVAVNLNETLSFWIENERRFYLPRILLLRDEATKVFGATVVMEDVTKLCLLDSIKTDLLSTVSHELKTPLTSVRMGIRLLLHGYVGEINPKQTEILTTAREDSERLLLTINNLLDLTRLEEGKSALTLEACQVKELVKASIQQTRDIAEAQHLGLSMSIAPQLPLVRVDRQRIGHVFTNLITNAIKHSPPRGKVSVQANLHGTQVRISVIDQGSGISKDYHQRIFEKFYRVPGQSKPGAGLGLSIAREITRSHGGTISVISEPGKGSEFCVDLPVFGAKTILVVDDNEGDRKLISRLLQKNGYAVLEAEGGRQGLVIFQENESQIDLVLTDILMPHMDGVQFVDHLRELSPEVKLLFLSGYKFEEKSAGHQTEVVEKSTDGTLLLAKIKEMLSEITSMDHPKCSDPMPDALLVLNASRERNSHANFNH